MPKSFSNLSSFRVLVIILAFLAVGAGLIATSRFTNPAKPEVTPAPEAPENINPPENNQAGSNTNPYVIYALSTQNNTQLLAKKAGESDSKIIAQLPDNIKHINYLSSEKIIFISDIDETDHGKFIKKYDSVANQYEILAEAQKDWGIDDVVISPDGSYIAWWEVKMTEANQLLNGLSRVYTKNITNLESTPVQLVDEKATETTPIHYPLFFDGANRLYLDSFIPNGGGLFYLGMYEADPNTPSSLTSIPELQKGDFLSDPEVSPDGKKILFTAYDKEAKVQISALSFFANEQTPSLNPNQIISMDLASRQKSILRNSDDGNQYANPKWSKTGNSIIYQGYQVTGPNSSTFKGVFLQEETDSTPTKINISNIANLTILDTKAGNIIWGKATTDVGNLGKKYAQIVSEIDTIKIDTAQVSVVIIQPSLQYIAASENINTGKGIFSSRSLQLASFKPNQIPQKRKDQQNSPPKCTLPIPSLAGGGISGFPFRPTSPPNRADLLCNITPGKNTVPAKNLPKCADYCGGIEHLAGCVNPSKCYDSPLYLYPVKQTPITIIPEETMIFSDSPKMKYGSWQVLASPDGKLISDNKEYSKISFGYFSPPQPPPKYGIVVEKEKLEITLKYFAANLNLAGREVDDFVPFWKNYLPNSPYYFISFYDQESAKKIISYYIDPPPDTFLQVIMYFKPLDGQISISPPVFNKVERKGFVAVDWSGIVDNK